MLRYDDTATVRPAIEKGVRDALPGDSNTKTRNEIVDALMRLLPSERNRGGFTEIVADILGPGVRRSEAERIVRVISNSLDAAGVGL